MLIIISIRKYYYEIDTISEISRMVNQTIELNFKVVHALYKVKLD